MTFGAPIEMCGTFGEIFTMDYSSPVPGYQLYGGFFALGNFVWSIETNQAKLWLSASIELVLLERQSARVSECVCVDSVVVVVLDVIVIFNLFLFI